MVLLSSKAKPCADERSEAKDTPARGTINKTAFWAVFFMVIPTSEANQDGSAIKQGEALRR